MKYKRFVSDFDGTLGMAPANIEPETVQAVKEYIDTKDFKKVDQIKRNILTLYRQDISKHAEGYNLKVESIFDEIPAQLQKHDKKFKLSSIKKR